MLLEIKVLTVLMGDLLAFYLYLCIAKIIVAIVFALYQRPCGLMEKALVFGTKDCRLESCQGHFN